MQLVFYRCIYQTKIMLFQKLYNNYINSIFHVLILPPEQDLVHKSLHTSFYNYFVYWSKQFKKYSSQNNNKWIAHNVQGLDIRSSEDYAQNTIETEKLFSSYTPQHDKYITVYCTKHIWTSCWPGGRFFSSRYDGGNHVWQSVSLHASDRILRASIPCWPLHRSFPLSSPIFPVALIVVPHKTLLKSVIHNSRTPLVRHIRIGIEQILRPLIPSWGISVSGFPALSMDA